MYRVIILSFAVLLATATATNVKRCKGGQPFPLSVNIEGCNSMPCDVIKGSTAVMDVQFVGTNNVITQLTNEVHASTFGITVPYELPSDVADVCANLKYGASCPISQSQVVVYQFNFHVEDWYPEIAVAVEVSLVDAHKESIACFVVDVQVRKG